ncbi:hypothetical protein EDD22DRAFT_773197 [Suillus occidentalis]|nr:hypothetical protein EDD22DRAFT_792230 [Suillus occidentalis]KAG1759202.1 hypothetical protein EDD22DRAFT_782883 [Suillus occidentalis]KAG1767460.1 hypothetical protein EDD22DRAFT_773197 [Suillus occidentalis]
MHTTSAIPEAAAARIQTTNGCKSYAYNLRNSITETLTDISWLDASQEASKEYDSEGVHIQHPTSAIPSPTRRLLTFVAGCRGCYCSHSDYKWP